MGGVVERGFFEGAGEFFFVGKSARFFGGVYKEDAVSVLESDPEF